MRLLNSTTDGVDILLDSLDPFTRYSVTLYASNSIMGEASEPTQFTTQEDGKYAVAYSYHDPLPIQDIRVSNLQYPRSTFHDILVLQSYYAPIMLILKPKLQYFSVFLQYFASIESIQLEALQY